MSPRRRERPYLRAEDRRRQLLDAAGHLFDRFGFRGITMAAVAPRRASAASSSTTTSPTSTPSTKLSRGPPRRYSADVPDISRLGADEAAATMFRHLLTIPSTDRGVVRLLVADIGLAALDRVRGRFRTEEPARWPKHPRSGRRQATASAVMWATTSALPSLADAVTTGVWWGSVVLDHEEVASSRREWPLWSQP